jgi:hypothetical protein
MDDETETNHRANQMPDLPGLCRLMFEGSPLPTATVEGAKHVVRYVNPAFCRLAGKSKDELIGNPFAEIVPEDGFLSFLDQVYRTGEAGVHTEPEASVIQTAYWSYAMWPLVSADEHPVEYRHAGNFPCRSNVDRGSPRLFIDKLLKFGYVKVRYRGIKKNANQVFTLCACAARSKLRRMAS